MPSFEATIEMEEDCVLTVEVTIDYTYTPGEAQTWDDPGCDEEAELNSVRVDSFIGGTANIVRDSSNEAVFKALDAAMEEYVENRWEERFCEEACEAYAQEDWDAQAERYERD